MKIFHRTLAAISVAPYITFYDTVNAMLGNLPLIKASAASDTAPINHFFVHLHEAFHNLESHWGPYRWDKIGYCFVPNAPSAMEHATNISLSDSYFYGNAIVGEQSIVHELSHHWFGDQVTCDNAAEMWLNEGWATFNEFLFFEGVYSADSAKIQIRQYHEFVLQSAAWGDRGYLPVSGVPLLNTFGITVYHKGADAVHTLRSYMGDSLFFPAVQGYLNYYAFNNGSTQKLQDYLSQYSGIDLSDFFNDWVLQPGFTHLSIEHVEVTPFGNNYQIQLQIRQRIKQAYHLFNNVPVTISYFNWDMSRHDETVMVSGECTDHLITLSYVPAYIALDFDEKIQDAISDEWMMIKHPGLDSFKIGLMNLQVNSLGSDSVLFRVEHNWIRADGMYKPIQNLHLDNFRYWTVGGVFDSTFKADVKVS